MQYVYFHTRKPKTSGNIVKDAKTNAPFIPYFEDLLTFPDMMVKYPVETV
jgi:hypothetical protein